MSQMSSSCPEQDRLSVLMVNTHQTGSGAGRVGELLSTGLRDAGHAVSSFVSRKGADGRSCRHVAHWRVAPLTNWLSAHGLPELGNLTSFLWRCRREYADADLLHLHNLHGDYLSIAALPLWGRDKPLVWTLHDCWALTGNCATPCACSRWRQSCGHCPLVGVYPMATVDRSRFYRRLKPRLIAAARPHLVTPSRWLAERVREVPELAGLPLTVIPNPIATDVFTPMDDRASLRRSFGLSPDDPTVVVVGCGWDDARKGGADAAAALRRAAGRINGLQVLVVGWSSDRLLAAAGVPGRAVPFAQDRDTLVRAYACADACLFPSRAENYPLTVLESLACGTPVVAYSVGGVPEQISHLETGYLARDGRPDELAIGLASLTGDRAAAREMGQRGRDFVLRTSSTPVVVKRYRTQYERAIRVWCRRRGRRGARFEMSRLGRWAAERLGWDDREPMRTVKPNVALGAATLEPAS